MNNFLKTRNEINEATKWLKDNGYVTHPISAKDWELKEVVECLTDGSIIDLGADGSRVLHNAVIKKINGRKVGVDLAEVTGDNKAEGVEYFKENLMSTHFYDGTFNTVVSLSTIEHEVDLNEFAKECSRLLAPKGKLIVSFDYFNPKVNTDGITLYGLKWNILDLHDVLNLVDRCRENGLELTSEIDWEAPTQVINDTYCSPAKGIGYTFGILEFIKK